MSDRGKLVREIVYLDIDECVDNWWNPNSETAETFNALFESVKDLGMVETIQVVPICDELREAFKDLEDVNKHDELMEQGYKWIVLHGSHRFETAKLLGKDDIAEIPAVVLEPSDVSKLRAMSVRMNVIKGALDADKFRRLWEQETRENPELKDEVLMDMMGFTSRAELDRLIKDTARDLPPELQRAFEAAKEEIKTIDDLSRVLNELFTRHGEDLKYAFMTFTWGGKLHTMVRLTKDMNLIVARLKQYCRENKADINDVLTVAIRHVLGSDERLWPEPQEGDLSIAE